MNVPNTLKYTKTHEWAKVEGGVVVVGITDHAQHELTDIVYVDDYPEIGSQVKKGDRIAVIESVKAVADVFAPVAGVLKETNKDLENAPEKLNKVPYDAWIVKLKPANAKDLDSLLTPEAYKKELSS